MYASNCLSGCQNDPIIKLFLFVFFKCGYFKTTATKSNHLNITLYTQEDKLVQVDFDRNFDRNKYLNIQNYIFPSVIVTRIIHSIIIVNL